MLSNPHRWPLWVGVILTQTSLLPEALTPSSKLANKESLSKVKSKSFRFDNEETLCLQCSTGLSAGHVLGDLLRISGSVGFSTGVQHEGQSSGPRAALCPTTAV